MTHNFHKSNKNYKEVITKMTTEDNRVFIAARMESPPRRTRTQRLTDFCKRTSQYDSRRTLTKLGIDIVDGPLKVVVKEDEYEPSINGTFYEITLPAGWTYEENTYQRQSHGHTVHDSSGKGRLNTSLRPKGHEEDVSMNLWK